ncbi:MAG: 2-dehydropantoate 2-reductase [Synergistaceae bacterium]|jgi:2-dehydropantoate 2-reductase|nr:2-dehydropantoate 2-reductase [Synergistaceae bacterium]
MKVAVLGAGAMGSLYGGLLAEAGNEVVLVDVWRDQVDAVNASGLSIEGAGGERRVRGIRAVSDASEAGTADLILVFVKATATEGAMRGALPMVGGATTVLTLQNGLGNVEKLCAVVPADRVVAGTTGHGATLLGPGRIRHAGVGDTIVGELDGNRSARVESLAAMFAGAGMTAQVSTNVIGLIWTKLTVNVGINALTAVTGLKNGRLASFPEAEALMRAAVDEACSVARRKGIQLEIDSPFEHAMSVAVKTGANRSSMLQDILAGRQTEIAVINGAIVEEGEKLGIPTPVNAVLTNLVLIRQQTYGEAFAV